MTYTSLADEIDAAARIVVEHGAISDESEAFAALRRAGYSTRWVGAAWQQIAERAAELVEGDDAPTFH
jgi:hypothetical protein